MPDHLPQPHRIVFGGDGVSSASSLSPLIDLDAAAHAATAIRTSARPAAADIWRYKLAEVPPAPALDRFVLDAER